MDYKNIKLEVKDNIAFLTLVRPKALNALNEQTMDELDAAFDYFSNDRNILGVIITGAGRGFCAGTDITEITAAKPGKSENLSERFGDYVVNVHRVFNKIENYERPVIAAVNGFALGGGCELALCCDIRIASTKAVFGQPEVDLGLIACYGGTQRLSKIVNVGIAKEIMYTGRKVSAEEAKGIGLVNKVVPDENLLNEAEELMKTIISKAPIAVKHTKACINKGMEVSLEYGLVYERNMIGLCLATEDGMEGINAFVEKRKPNFKKNKPLKGVKVVDFTLFAAGPATSKMLADWGADVIKVEAPKGDPFRKTGNNMGVPTEEDFNPLWNFLNSNKRGISVDLKTPEGAEIMDKLLSKANVFVTSFRTGALERLGLDYETMSKKYPHIVWGQINGFGDYGHDKDNPGFDTVAFWARSGAMLDLAEKGTPPVNPLIAFGDNGTACSLAAGICAALYEKARTGKGQKIMVSLFGQAIWNNGTPFIATQFGDEYPKTRTEPSMPFINSYKCKDDKWIFISVLEHDRYYNTVCKVFGREDLVDKPEYCTTIEAKKRAPEITAIFDQEFAKYTQAEVVEMLKAADIAHERVRGTYELKDDPQALANNYVYEVVHANGQKSFAPSNPV